MTAKTKTSKRDALWRALLVMVLDVKISAFLLRDDPRALEQALDALGAESGVPKGKPADLAERLRAFRTGFGQSPSAEKLRKLSAGSVKAVIDGKSVMAAWRGPASLCTCGHTGDCKINDEGDSEHGGITGHGQCLVDDCSCGKFTWSQHRPELLKKLEEAAK